MRTAVLGGTRFIGRAIVDELLAAGHEVCVIHRGEHEPGDLPDVEHLHIGRRRLADHAERLRVWMEQIIAAAGADIEFVRVRDEELPEALEITGRIAQDWYASAEKAKRLLDWRHANPEACVRSP